MKRFLLSSLSVCSILCAQEGENPDEIAMLEPEAFRSFSQNELALTIEPHYKNPFITVGLACLSPGLGHVYLGDLKTAAGLGSSLAFAGIGSLDLKSNTFQMSNFIALQNTWFYNIYAAYRDVNTYNHSVNQKYKIPKDSLVDLSLASFKWSIIKKPQVWGGVLGALTAGIVVGSLLYEPKAELSASPSSSPIFPLMAFPVGIGEEALFRGFLQPCLAELTSPVGGIILSSLAFTAIHIPNAYYLPEEQRFNYFVGSLPLIATLGSYFGYLAYKSGSLQESVAVHAWYDFALFMLSYSVASSAITKQTSFSLSIPF